MSRLAGTSPKPGLPLPVACWLAPWHFAFGSGTEGATDVATLVKADAAETALRGVVSFSTLVGVVLAAALGWSWADPAESFVVVCFAVREGKPAWVGNLE